MALSGNATLYAQGAGQTIDKLIGSKILSGLYETSIMPAWMNQQAFGNSSVGSSKVAGWTVEAAVSAPAVSEGASATIQQFSTTSITATMGKRKVVYEISDEALAAGGFTLGQLNPAAYSAIAEGVDTDATALFSGISASVGTTATALAPSDLVEGLSVIGANKIKGAPVAVLASRQIFNLQDALITSGASVYTDRELASAVNGFLRPNNFAGNVAGIPVYRSELVPDDATDKTGCLFVPDEAFGMATANSISQSFLVDVEKGREGVVSGGTYLAVSFFFAVTELRDGAATKVISGVAA